MINGLVVDNIHVVVDTKEVLSGINLTALEGNITVVMGPNGSGKTSLALSLLGNFKYKVTKGSFILNGEDLNILSTEERAKIGLFLAFQTPPGISGVSISEVIKIAYKNQNQKENINFWDFRNVVLKKADNIKISQELIDRDTSISFSGGEKKKSEILQMVVLRPKIAVLDEIDSGLDLDAIKNVAKIINIQKKQGMGFLIITHSEKMIDLLDIDKIYVMKDGKVVKSGNREIVKEIEKVGYDKLNLNE